MFLTIKEIRFLVFSSLCNFCAKPDFSLSLCLGILRFFPSFGRLQVGACVGVLRQLSSWQGLRSKILYKTRIAYLAFVNEFILFGRRWQTPSLSRITWREKSQFFFNPVLANCFRVHGFTFIYYLCSTRASYFRSRCCEWFLTKRFG